jgi:hypothetical protein
MDQGAVFSLLSMRNVGLRGSWFLDRGPPLDPARQLLLWEPRLSALADFWNWWYFPGLEKWRSEGRFYPDCYWSQRGRGG